MHDATTVAADEHTHLVLWGDLPHRTTAAPIILCRGARTATADLTAPEVRRLLAGGDSLDLVLPPFAAVDWDGQDHRFVAAVDWLGMRHLYVGEGPGLVGLSSSAAVLGGTAHTGLDRESIGTQALLGWQLGTRTPFAGVTKVPPGTRVALSRGELSASVAPRARATELAEPHVAPRHAAQRLSHLVSTYLDDHPGTALQLTGGLDSRILLGAVPRARRRSTHAVTLAVPGSPDVAIAARLAAEHGMTHRVVELRGLGSMTDEDAWSRCVAAARDLECSADPLALASLRSVQAALGDQPRLAGLGGEVARGFYYIGPTTQVGVTRLLASTLARWRLIPNERVDADALDPSFAAMAEETVITRVYQALDAAADDWWPATDEFYLWHRMQRWAGTLASASCFDSVVINPMLDHGFLQVARHLPPKEKRNMLFLSRVLLELDPGLADIPLDHRPSPRTYALPSPVNRARLTAAQTRKVIGKAAQRWTGTTHAAAGGDVLADKVVRHWREDPATLDHVRELGVFRTDWLDEVLAGRRSADPSAVALLVNLAVACDSTAAVSVGSGSRST